MIGNQAQRRAQRYAIATSLLFRRRGDPGWRAARTLNLSSTGVLFRADGPAPDPGCDVEFILTLPLFEAPPGTQVRCTGRVVRVTSGGLASEGCAVATTIMDYEFLKRQPD